MSSYSSASIPSSSQIINDSSLSLIKHAQIIILIDALLNVFLTYFRLSLFLNERMIHCCRELTSIQILDSFNQMTCFQSFTVQSLYFKTVMNASGARIMLEEHEPSL